MPNWDAEWADMWRNAKQKHAEEEEERLAKLQAKYAQYDAMAELREQIKAAGGNVVQGPWDLNTRLPDPTVVMLKSFADLRTKEFDELKYVVPGYIAAGCTILAGRPKIGKSWLTLDIAIAVASGGEVLGKKCEHGDVLYLALEDNDRRMKSRGAKLLSLVGHWPERMAYQTTWPKVDDHGIDLIRDWIKRTPEPRLVVVDVLERIRADGKKSDDRYRADYAAVKDLQTLASETNVAIVIVHHVRKAPSESGDPFEMISGTNGLVGAADAALVLNRTSQGVTLAGRGRDVEGIETAMEFDGVRCRWIAKGPAAEVQVSDTRKQIIDLLRSAAYPLTQTQIAEGTGLPASVIKKQMWRMVKASQVEKQDRNGKTTYSVPVEPVSPPGTGGTAEPWNLAPLPPLPKI